MQKYSGLSIFLHWLVAILIIAAFAMGTCMTEMRISPAKLQYYAWHKWLGVSILGLVAVRLLVRLWKGAPSYQASLKPWEKNLASATHLFLYFLMFAVPISGYLYTYAAGFPVVYLGIVQLPSIVPPMPELKNTFKEIHEILTTVMAILVAMHFGAALKHKLIDKDGTLERMLPSKN